MDAEVSMGKKDGLPQMHKLAKNSSKRGCFGLGQKNSVASTLTASNLSTSDIDRQGNFITVSRYSQTNASTSRKQDKPDGSDTRNSHNAINKVSIFKEQDGVSAGTAVERSGRNGPSFKITRSNRKVGAEIERSDDTEIERNVSGHIEGQGNNTGCSSCFGGAIMSMRSLSSEGSTLSNHGFSGYVSRVQQCRRSNGASHSFGRGLSRHSLRKFSCISSGDVVPAVTNPLTNGARNHTISRHKSATRNTKHKNLALSRLKNCKNSVMNSVGCTYRRNVQGTASADPSLSQSVVDSATASTSSRLCLMRPASIKADTEISDSPLAYSNSALQETSVGHFAQGREISRIPTESLESISRATAVDGEMVSQRVEGNGNRSLGLSGRQLEAIEIDRRNIIRQRTGSDLSSSTGSFMHDDHNVSSPMFSGPPFSSRNALLPSMFGMPQHTRSIEAISPSSSYASSPDAESHRLHSYTSRSQSPNLSRADSSPDSDEGRYIRAAETPVYRPFRRFSMRSFEENQLCYTYEGLSEILSAREHVERDEIAYEQQLFMLEANMFLGGMASHDHYRDMRLDVDSMSYEELLALEESIGNVCTGLGKDAILRSIKIKKYSFMEIAANSVRQDSEVKCSICQEEFEEGVELGILECGHNHHYLCIEQWLLQKNQCPICKASASS